MPKSKRAQRLEQSAEQIRVCVKCPLYLSRTNAVPGDGKPTAKLMIIGEAPGRESEKRNNQPPFLHSSLGRL